MKSLGKALYDNMLKTMNANAHRLRYIQKEQILVVTVYSKRADISGERNVHKDLVTMPLGVKIISDRLYMTLAVDRVPNQEQTNL